MIVMTIRDILLVVLSFLAGVLFTFTLLTIWRMKNDK